MVDQDAVRALEFLLSVEPIRGEVLPDLSCHTRLLHFLRLLPCPLTILASVFSVSVCAPNDDTPTTAHPVRKCLWKSVPSLRALCGGSFCENLLVLLPPPPSPRHQLQLVQSTHRGVAGSLIRCAQSTLSSVIRGSSWPPVQLQVVGGKLSGACLPSVSTRWCCTCPSV